MIHQEPNFLVPVTNGVVFSYEMCVHDVCGGDASATAHMWGPEDDFVGSVLVFHFRRV